MSDKIESGIIAAAIAAVVALGSLMIFAPSVPQNVLTDVGNQQAIVGATFASFSSTLFSHLTNLQVNNNFDVVGVFGQGGDGNTGTILQTQVVTGTCNTASSTIFAFQNPFTSTSTVSQLSISGTQGATTSDIMVGTSTTPSPAVPTTATSTLGTNLLNLAAVTASKTFYSVAGVSVGPGTGYNNAKGIPSSVTNQEIVLGPNEYIYGFSTSTAGGSTNGGTGAKQVAVPASCTYKAEVQS